MRWVAVAVGVVGILSGLACSSGSEDPSAITEASTTSTTTATSVAAPVPTTAPAGVTIFDFAEPGSIGGWSTVNDTVMGGVSNSSVTWEEGALLFAGSVSLENNGGFTSVVSPVVTGLGAPVVGAEALVLTGQGDGREYVVQLRAASGGQLWTQTFTSPTALAEVVLPLGGFVASDFMLDLVAPAPVDVAAVDRLAIYLTDGQAGPFRLDVRRISAR